MKNVALTVACSLAFLFLVPICSAVTTITTSSAPTVDLAGLTTWTLTAQSDQGDIIGFNFDSSGASGFGFIGSMNQVNPFGLTTIFDDVGPGAYLGDGAHISQDSHFGVAGSTGIVVNPFEDGNSLFGAWNTTTGNFPILTLAQLTIPDGQSVSYLGEITVAGTGGNILESVTGNVGGSVTNTPPMVVDQFVVVAKLNPVSNLQLLATDAEDGDNENLAWSWTGLSGPGLPFNTPTLTADGKFSWDSLGSANGFYTSMLTVEDSGMLMDMATLTVQVPEPGTLILAGLSLVGVFASRRRNS
ncbi:MAG: PEP-CTERM sorting domain-containing protein [Planctomycetes bacterium]|nr:PEP-CTERM sorting domain-containing protein [Planctomycetota bacterium]